MCDVRSCRRSWKHAVVIVEVTLTFSRIKWSRPSIHSIVQDLWMERTQNNARDTYFFCTKEGFLKEYFMLDELFISNSW